MSHIVIKPASHKNFCRKGWVRSSSPESDKIISSEKNYEWAEKHQNGANQVIIGNGQLWQAEILVHEVTDDNWDWV
jgi:hypothetical protein